MRRVALLAAIWCGFASFAAPAVAAAPADVFAAAELLGTWSPDCSLPVSVNNPRVTWRVDGDTVEHTVSFDGATAAFRDRVGTVEPLGRGLIRFSLIRGGRLTLTVTVAIRDGRAQTVRSVGADGRVFYDRGIELRTGRPAVSDEHCAAAIS